MKISENKTVHTKILTYTPTIQNKRLYVNLQPFLNDLGFDYLVSNNSITILKKLTSITINNDKELTLNKNSRIKISSGHILTNPNRIFWDFSFTKCPNKAIKTGMKTVKTITFGQRTTTCRMVFHLSDTYKATITNHSPMSTSFTLIKNTNKAILLG